jgi:transcriptional regulator with XRE-family HTH domain
MLRRVGESIRERRVQAGLTQLQLAGLSSLSRGSIANIERGQQNLTLETLWSIASCLGCEARELIPMSEDVEATEGERPLEAAALHEVLHLLDSGGLTP